MVFDSVAVKPSICTAGNVCEWGRCRRVFLYAYQGDEIAGIVKGFNLRAWDRCEVILKGTKLRDNYGSRRGRFVMNERGKSHV